MSVELPVIYGLSLLTWLQLYAVLVVLAGASVIGLASYGGYLLYKRFVT